MRRFASIVLATALISSSALAAEGSANGALVAGKPAGVKEASLAGNGLLLIFGAVIVAGGIALVATQGHSSNISVTTTGTAP